MPTPLSETDSFVLFTTQEDIFLFDKDLNQTIWKTSMYGNATCGWVGLSNDWVVIGGEFLLLWKAGESLRIIHKNILSWIHDIRQIDEYKIEILTDPYAEISAIWQLDIQTEKLTKIKDFLEYINKPYEENILW